jgi:UDP-N-acetylmuramate-alanine ligase
VLPALRDPCYLRVGGQPLISCAHLLGLPMEEIASAASSFRSPRHRCSLHQVSSGIVIVSDAAKAPGGTPGKVEGS